MTRCVKRDELDEVFCDLDHPVARDRLADQSDDVELVYADGEESFPVAPDRIEYETFASPGDRTTEIVNTVKGVEEPGQSGRER